MINSFIIGEFVGKFRTVQVILSTIIVIPAFFRRLFGGIGNSPIIFGAALAGATAFLVVIKLLMNLEQNLIF
jgi:hypothetical protein